MFYIVVSIICIALVAAVLALYVRDRHYCMNLREEVDRAGEEKNIVIEFLHKMAEDVEGLDSERLYKRIVRITALSCGAMSACVYEKMPDGKLKPRAVEGLFPPQTKRVGRQRETESRVDFLENALLEEIVEPNEGIIGEVATDGRGILIKDAEKDPRIIKHTDEALKISSIMIVPMVFGEHLYGVIAVVNPISGKAFTETDFSLAKSLGEQAGLSIRNIEALSALILKNKMEYDLRLASSVQHYLLPSKLPHTEHLQFAVKYFPQQLIGGDFYDFFKLSDGRLGLVVGDVSGKGISAAILMAICQTKLRYIARENAAPAETLKKLNAEMYSSMRSDMFITMVYAIIEKDTSRITLARAGHELPLLYKARNGDEPAEKIRCSGMAVGMVEPELFDETIEDVSVDFETDDILALYTDGITEATDKKGDEFSVQKLAQTISTLHARNANDINEEVMKAVERFTGGGARYSDDITLVCLKKI